jgi:2-dehydro-3-deoxyphosphooctonate aldolase (KDO 8-P synthase)
MLWKKIITKNKPFFLIAGPCVIESEEMTHAICHKLVACTQKYGIPLIFKASFDKANRTSLKSFRGLGLKKGLEILNAIKKSYQVPLLTDVHETHQCPEVAEIVDIIQIPALLSRQTDLIIAASKTNKIINIKKGQFMAPWDMKHAIEKAREHGNEKIIVTERGSSFGYNNLILDFRSLGIMKEYGKPVVLDVSHSVQLPSARGDASEGNKEFIAPLARAAVAFGIDGIFMEVHEKPEKALSDGPNSFKLNDLPALLHTLVAIHQAVQ